MTRLVRARPFLAGVMVGLLAAGAVGIGTMVPLVARNHYLPRAPGLLRYCIIPIGTPKWRVVRLLGRPTAAFGAPTEAWRAYRGARQKAGWNVPQPDPSDTILVYEVEMMGELRVFYYFVGPHGVLRGVYVGET